MRTDDFDPDAPFASIQDCAIAYRISQWRRDEAVLLAKFARRPDGSAIAKAAALFGVARQFPGSAGDADARASMMAAVEQPLAIAINGLSDTNLADRVVALSESLKAIPNLVRQHKLKPINTISASSKFVWCAKPDVGVIYDERARDHLNQLGHDVARWDYRGFVDAFHAELTGRYEELDQALLRLGSLADRSWMKRKLLDYWLYTNGALAGSAGRET